MHVVPDAGAVGGGVIGAIQVHRASGAGRRERNRHEVGFHPVRLAEACVGRGTSRVEVAQCGRPQAVGGVERGEQAFSIQLGPAVDAGRPLRCTLGNRDGVGVPVDRRAGGVDDGRIAILAQGLREVEGADDVAAVETRRVDHRQPRLNGAREVDNRLRPRRSNRLTRRGLIGQVDDVQVGLRWEQGAMPG